MHESVANTDHDDASNLKQGYSIANPYLSADLVGFWPLQEDSGTTANDFSGNANDGTTNGGVTVNQTGILGTSAYSFDGTDDYVSLADLGITTGDFTVTGWFNVGTWDSPNPIVWNDTDSDPNPGYQLRLSGTDSIQFVIGDGSSRVAVNNAGYSTGQWYFAAGVADRANGTVYLYVDGTEVDSAAESLGSVDNSVIAKIGESGDGGHFDGKITDARIYNRALTASEIQTLYDVVNTAGTLTTPYKTV